MLFILIPLLLIVVAAIGIGIIVFRKFSYLQKLTPESHQVGSTFWHDLMPEVIEGYQNIQFKEFKEKFLLETEKLLRRMRLVFVSIDRLSDSLIRKVRRVHRESVATLPEQQTPSQVQAESESVSQPKPRKLSVHFMNAEALKQEEQRLIVAIAQDPKNPSLYHTLGDVYARLKNYTDAAECFEAALRLDPQNEKLQKKLDTLKAKLRGDEKEIGEDF